MRYFVLTILLCSGLAGYAQRGGAYPGGDMKMSAGSLFFTDINGFALSTRKYTDLVEGSPYFRDEWMRSIIVMPNGKVYQGVYTRIDLLHNELLFRNARGEELILNSPVKEVVVTDSLAGKEFRFLQSASLTTVNKSGWYLQLAAGPVSLYKVFDKEVRTNQRYGSASEEQRITTREKYFLLQDGSLTEVKKLKEAGELLSRKKPEVSSFVQKQRAGEGSLEQKLTELVGYFNSLQ